MLSSSMPEEIYSHCASEQRSTKYVRRSFLSYLSLQKENCLCDWTFLTAQYSRWDNVWSRPSACSCIQRCFQTLCSVFRSREVRAPFLHPVTQLGHEIPLIRKGIKLHESTRAIVGTPGLSLPHKINIIIFHWRVLLLQCVYRLFSRI